MIRLARTLRRGVGERSSVRQLSQRFLFPVDLSQDHRNDDQLLPLDLHRHPPCRLPQKPLRWFISPRRDRVRNLPRSSPALLFSCSAALLPQSQALPFFDPLPAPHARSGTRLPSDFLALSDSSGQSRRTHTCIDLRPPNRHPISPSARRRRRRVGQTPNLLQTPVSPFPSAQDQEPLSRARGAQAEIAGIRPSHCPCRSPSLSYYAA